MGSLKKNSYYRYVYESVDNRRHLYISNIDKKKNLVFKGLQHYSQTYNKNNKARRVLEDAITTNSPAASQQRLSVHLGGTLAPELSAGEVGVVRGVDVVVAQGLVHVLVNV